MLSGDGAGLVFFCSEKGENIMEQGIYELKYCERCGSLGTRHTESSETYCEACARVLTHCFLPGAGGLRLRSRKARASKKQSWRVKVSSQPAAGRLQ
jgi:hypothetical protein